MSSLEVTDTPWLIRGMYHEFVGRRPVYVTRCTEKVRWTEYVDT